MQPLGENTLNTPAFLGKLWKMVNDPSTDHLISWSPSGNSFIIQNQAQFWYELLPLYYKHNNMSSFVRQLNMYGFHKMSTVENGTMDGDKDEIQFTHQYFQKNRPELLRNIKRKVTTAKSTLENNHKHDELAKVLTDVKQLRNRQATVDTQLNAMEQENALLWREVAILRQKHLKQQKIVNKLIQFLVTLVQPSRISTVGMKRPYHLMIHESPTKKPKGSTNKKPTSESSEGPTIHELDSELELSPNLYEGDAPLVENGLVDITNNVVYSPATSVSSQQNVADSPLPSILQVDNKNQYADANDLADQELADETIETIISTNDEAANADKIFLNPTTQDTLLSNLSELATPTFTAPSTEDKKFQMTKNQKEEKQGNESNGKSLQMLAVATRDKALGDVIKSLPGTSECYETDLNSHIESTQNELDQLKDILNGYTNNSFVDANALLGELCKMPSFNNVPYLFTDEAPYDDMNLGLEKNENLIDSADPLVSGSELTPYVANFDFNELFDESLDGENSVSGIERNLAAANDQDVSVNTPQIIKEEPVFPAIQQKKQ